MSLIEQLSKSKLIKNSAMKNETPEFISTGCLTLNLLFSGKMDGGIQIGKVSQIVAPSSLGKSMVGMKVARNAQRKGMEVFYMDTEFAYSDNFAESVGIDADKILVVQNNQIEEVQQIIISSIEEIPKEDRKNLLLIIDSWGGLVTSKTYNDAVAGKDTTDMTVSKKKNSLARLLTGLGCTVFVINQTYECGTEDMMVRTPEGDKSLKDFKVGDLVETTNGIEVVQSTTKHEQVAVSEIILENGEILKFTDFHRFRVGESLENSVWKYVADIRPGDNIILVESSSLVSSIKNIGFHDVYDIETPTHDYILSNGVVSHNTMDQYNPLAVGGGKGIYFASTSIVMGTSKAKTKGDDGEQDGSIISAKAQKSRLSKEGAKLKYLIEYDGGINPYWGILDDALDGEYVVKPNMGWYSRPSVEGDKKWREAEIWENAKEFWEPILKKTDFMKYMQDKYSFSGSTIQHLDEDLF